MECQVILRPLLIIPTPQLCELGKLFKSTLVESVYLVMCSGFCKYVNIYTVLHTSRGQVDAAFPGILDNARRTHRLHRTRQHQERRSE